MLYLIIGCWLILMVTGQVFFKLAAARIALSEKGFISSFILNPQLIFAVTLYMIATVLWVWILNHLPLKQAYPLNALGFVLIPLVAYFFFTESLNLGYWIGITLIVIGVLLTQYFS